MAQAEIERQAGEIDALKTELVMCQAQLGAWDQEVEELKAPIATVTAELEVASPLAESVPGLKAKVVSLEAQLSEETTLHRRVLNMHSAFRQECDEWEAKLRRPASIQLLRGDPIPASCRRSEGDCPRMGPCATLHQACRGVVSTTPYFLA